MNRKNGKQEKKSRKHCKKVGGTKVGGGTRKMKPMPNNKDKSHMVKIFLEILNMVKLYHWKTHSYAQHKATDELYSKLNEHIDEFVEVLLGKDGQRIKMMEKRIELIDPNNIKDFKSRIYEYRTFLTEFNMHFDSKRDSDLLSLRDQLLADINQFLYLLTLSA
jgi:DNA-binding ferritin-like protein